jgi:hypothetical protein
MSYPDNEFLDAYERNRQIQVDEIVESSQVATVLVYMMFEKYGDKDIWEGTPTALYGEIINIVNTDANKEPPELNINYNDRYFPKNAKQFGSRLNEIIPTLKDKGLEITRYKESDRLRTRKIKICKVLSESSERSENENSCSNLDNFSDNPTDNSTDNNKVMSENIDLIHAQNQDFGQRTTSDDDIRLSIVDDDIQTRGSRVE